MKHFIPVCLIALAALSATAREKDEPVSWTEMNSLFGVDIWQDECLWDDSTEEVARRMKLKPESKTDFMENHRAYPLGKTNVLNEAVYTIVLYGGPEHAESLMFVFLNQGDIPCESKYPSREFIEEMTKKIEASGEHVRDTVIPVLGEPERDSIGRGNMRQYVERWDWNGHAIILISHEGKYTMMRIIPSEQADRGDKAENIKSIDLRERMKSCVEQRENGDVVIRNIPMINQGPKGYCSPATWERYLRYLGMKADMYQLAMIAHTGIGGGTYSEDIITATQNLLNMNGRKLKEIGDKLEIDEIAKYIDQGMPVMWSYATEYMYFFQRDINRNTARRNGEEYKERKEPKDLDNSRAGHICLIIGYNKKTGEIAISDSWGPKYAERWLPLTATKDIYSMTWAIKW